MKSTQSVVVLLGSLLGLAQLAHATPSGLNNIPTADTAPHRAVVVQTFDTFGSGKHNFWTGFKTGWEFPGLRLEWGLDSHLAPTPAGPLYFQTKAGFDPWENGKVAVGVANVAFTDTDRAGDPFSYAVLSQDLGFARLHAGYGFQTDGNTVLLGIDRNFKVLERNLSLNADLVQTRDGEGWLPAVGLKYDISKHIVFETWINIPDDLTAALLGCAGADKDRLHIVYATGDKLPNDEILSASMVAHVLEKFGIEKIRIVDGGLRGWVEAGLEPCATISATLRVSFPPKENPKSPPTSTMS